MIACGKHMSGWEGWTAWPKGSQKHKLSKFNMEFWIKILSEGWGMSYSFNKNITDFNKCVFLLKCIEFNVIEEHVITFKFNKDNSMNPSTFLAQQPHGQLNKNHTTKDQGDQTWIEWCFFIKLSWIGGKQVLEVVCEGTYDKSECSNIKNIRCQWNGIGSLTCGTCFKVHHATHFTQYLWKLCNLWITCWDSSINWIGPWRFEAHQWWHVICWWPFT